ncbi:MAG: beta-ketoacyl synthase chain length factor [Verrucomicrobia bacterium]|nr:beta-ketoacyl synthase chain length factor [Verrucomicrobiota bacterium]MBV9658372.1 beta-ketoacyl synthase chain length factor [Verrucomicrobiota bacterium]
MPPAPLRRYLKKASAEGIFHAPMADTDVRAWMGNFPPNVARRMTRLGLLLGHALRDFSVAPADAVIYASTFGEASATERYLASFPAASPLFFQTSIHPSAIEQVLINRGWPVRELTPLAGRAGVAAHAALCALTTPGERVFLTGGEEIATWLTDIGAASPVAFAFALRLDSAGGDDALGELSFQPSAVAADEKNGAASAGGELPELFLAIQERRAARWRSPAGGEVELTWY